MNREPKLSTPVQWYGGMPQPASAGELTGHLEASLRYFDSIPAAIDQPALSQNVVAIHLKGPKRVHRWQSGRAEVWDVAENSLTLMPAFRANRWLTEGPIAFAHLALSPGTLARLADEEFASSPPDLVLQDHVGVVDPLTTQLMLGLLREFAAPAPNSLYRDSLVTALAITILRRYSTFGTPSAKRPSSGGLAGWQLRRVVDYMTENMAQDIRLAQIVTLTGLSRAQFFRAFRQSTGASPARYLLSLRMQHARNLLSDPGRTVESVAGAVGYRQSSHFADAFNRSFGITPLAWRRTAAVLDGDNPSLVVES